ncbi:MAG: outer membrane beta-barrel protein [Pyrinomonadaceae bacterium]
MKKIFLAFCLTAISGLAAFAQSTDEYKKGEFFVGYSNGQVDTGIDREDGNEFEEFFNERETFNGFEAAGVYNVSRYVGIKGDVSGTYNSKDFRIPVSGSTVSFNTRSSLYNFLGGIQIKDNATESRLKPFAHALVGAGHGRVETKDLVCPTGVDCTGLEGTESETGLAGAFGGGLDIKINNRVDFRAIQVDYNPIKFDGGTQHNVRFGIGFVFK